MNIQKVIETIRKFDSCADLHYEYAERGYSTDKPIITANWNEIPKKLERFLHGEIEQEWSDEWYTCDHCQKLVRLRADSCSWTPYYHIFNDSEIVCGNCIKANFANDYLTDILNNPEKINCFLDLKAEGFEQVNTEKFENGFHHGQTDDPRKILSELQKTGPDYDYVFGELTASQFDISFCVFRRKKQNDTQP